MIKSNEEVGVKYMQEWEEKIIEQRRAREEGLEEGRKQGLERGLEQGRKESIAVLIDTLQEIGLPEDQILEKVMKKYDLSAEQTKAYLTK